MLYVQHQGDSPCSVMISEYVRKLYGYVSHVFAHLILQIDAKVFLVFLFFHVSDQ